MTDQNDQSTAPVSGVTLGSSLTGDEPTTPEQGVRAPREALPPDAAGWWWGLGRRKSAVARVRIRPASDGKGGIKVQVSRKQFKTIEDYFSEDLHRADAVAPLKLTELGDNLEVIARINGGGITGQSQALRLGIARAILNYDPQFEDALRESGYLTRDARKVERKKYGQPGARRRYQFSKR